MKITKRRLRRIIKEEFDQIQSPPPEIDASQKVQDIAIGKGKTAAEAAGKKMLTSSFGRAKLADMIDVSGNAPEDLRNWAIDTICGVAQTTNSSPAQGIGALGVTAGKICRIIGQAGTIGLSGGSTWFAKKITPHVADYIRNMSNEDAAALWDVGKEVVSTAFEATEEIKTESKTKITKNQLKRIIREEKSKLTLEGRFDDDPIDRINSLAQTMFAAYNNISASMDDAEEVLPTELIVELENVLDTLEKVSEKISSETKGVPYNENY